MFDESMYGVVDARHVSARRDNAMVLINFSGDRLHDEAHKWPQASFRSRWRASVILLAVLGFMSELKQMRTLNPFIKVW
ncbi:MAG: hypothetical protein ACI8W7_001150 [Gammaproteobacteria bacterium]|jgi:hypothetical protein